LSLKGRGIRKLSPGPAGEGYLKVNLSDGKSREDHYVHRLVLRAFIGGPSDNQECLHLNGNPKDNSLENLKWGTSTENSIQSRDHGTMSCGERHYCTKLTKNQAKKIKYLANNTNMTHKEIAEKFPVSSSHVSDIKRGEKWSHLD